MATGNMSSAAARDLHDVKGEGVEQFNKLADTATNQISQVANSIEHAADKVIEQGRDAGERVGEVAGNMQTALNKSIKDQPMATIAVIAAAGFVLGALWKS